MQIRIFIGLTDFVEQRVNDFCKGVEVVDIPDQRHRPGLRDGHSYL